MRVIGLGAGLANCLMGYWLSMRGHEVILIEKNKTPGGMCRTFYYEDLSYEYGPHILYSNDKEVIDFFEYFVGFTPNDFYLSTFVEGNVLTYPLIISELEKFPFGNEIINEINNLSGSIDETNFETFLISNVGKKAYELFYEGFTQKFWNTHPAALSANWAKTRELKIKKSTEHKAFSALYQGYPKTDYNGLISALVQNIKIVQGNIVKFDDGVVLDSGEKIRGDFYINTIPLDELFACEFGKLGFVGFNLELTVYDQQYMLPIHPSGNHTAWMYYPSLNVNYTRQCEYKTINKKQSSRTIIGTEVPSAGFKLYPYYSEYYNQIFMKYLDKIGSMDNFANLGRLGLFIYTTMGNTYAMAKYLVDIIDKWKLYSHEERKSHLLHIRSLANKGA